MNRKQRRNKTSKEFAEDIIRLIFSLPTKNLLELNKAISQELNNRSDINDYLNTK